jgi:SH3-like domain-containing protein
VTAGEFGLSRRALLAALPAAFARGAVAADPLRRGSETGLALPRFASLKARVANLRRGPGLRYPIAWVYHRRGLPVLILREFGHWRQLRLPDGTRGWMHRGMLTRERRFVVTAAGAVLRAAPHDTARPVARLRPGVTGKLHRCDPGAWCAVTSRGYDGYVRRTQIWGSDADAP